MKTDTRVLVVDDELSIRVSLAGWLKKFGYQVDLAEEGATAVRMVEQRFYDLLLLDIKMPGMDGIEVLSKVRELSPDTIVVMMTAHGSIESAVESMKMGARDYLMKPFDPAQLNLLVEKFVQQRRLMDENRLLRSQVREQGGFQNLIGVSECMQHVFEMVRQVAQSESAVLIQGETGTGKELVAKAIHALSPRCYEPFIAINCGAFTESLLEGELFGYEKGAFTGARHARKGRLEMAHNGTLFLDEVGEISPKMQVDLLRVLQEKRFHRLGNPSPLEVDFRLISATHRDLNRGLQEGWFRQDFYYRINVITLDIPPLRERKEDIPLLAQFFLERYARETAKRFTGFSKDALELLVNYDWPGNVRELENVVERAVVLARGERIVPECLPFGPAAPSKPTGKGTLDGVLEEHIRDVLDAAGWNLSKAAEILGIHRSTLYKKMEKHRIRKPEESGAT